MSRLRGIHVLCVTGILLSGCEGASLLAEGGSSSRLNIGLSLNLDIFRFDRKPPSPTKIPPPKSETEDDVKEDGEAQ